MAIRSSLFRLARRLRAMVPLCVGVKSKSQRGFELIEMKPARSRSRRRSLNFAPE